MQIPLEKYRHFASPGLLMLDLLLLLANLVYFGSPLIFGAATGLVLGKSSSRTSRRQALLWGLVIGLIGVAITTVIQQSYSYWNDNLRGWRIDQDGFDHWMISIRPLIGFAPLCLSALAVGATLLVLRFKLR